MAGMWFLPEIVDKTSNTTRYHYRVRNRMSPQIDIVVVHRNSFSRGNVRDNYLSVHARYVVLPDGTIVQLHPIDSYLVASSAFNDDAISVEFVGNFPDEYGRYWKGDENGRSVLYNQQIGGGRDPRIDRWSPDRVVVVRFWPRERLHSGVQLVTDARGANSTGLRFPVVEQRRPVDDGSIRKDPIDLRQQFILADISGKVGLDWRGAIHVMNRQQAASCCKNSGAVPLDGPAWDVEADDLFDASPIHVPIGADAHCSVFAAAFLGLGHDQLGRVATDA